MYVSAATLAANAITPYRDRVGRDATAESTGPVGVEILMPKVVRPLYKYYAAGSMAASARAAYPGRMDDDLHALTRDELLAEVKKLREGIRRHRDSTGQDLCWHHPALWGLLPEKTDPIPAVPDWPAFMEGCVKYRRSLDERRP
jgi:hypothetical protein